MYWQQVPKQHYKQTNGRVVLTEMWCAYMGLERKNAAS